MTTNTRTTVHPSTRGVHYLYLNDGHGRMVGCIATVRRGQKLFLGTSFCSATGGDTFRKSQGRAIAEGRAVRRAAEQEKIGHVLSSKAVDQECEAAQFLTRAQHALCVDLDLLTDCSAEPIRPNAFDVLKAILQSVIEFDSDLDDRMELPYCEWTNETSTDAQLCDAVCNYFAALELPGGLVRAARRKLNDVSVEASKRVAADVKTNAAAIQNTVPNAYSWRAGVPRTSAMFDGTVTQAVRAGDAWDASPRPAVGGTMLPTPPAVLGPVIPPIADATER